MTKFQVRSAVVEAVQYADPEHLILAQDRIAEFMDRNIGIVGGMIELDHFEGDRFAHPGSWVVRSADGEFYALEADVFAALFEPVEP